MTREQIGGELPPLDISNETLKQLLINQFATGGRNYSFTSFTQSISSIVIKNRLGFSPTDNITYRNTEIGQYDKARIRELIWDMIITRHLTVGGAGSDDWPSFSVTERGLDYFKSEKR